MLNDALRQVAAEDAVLNTSPAVEARLRCEVESIARARRRTALKMYAAAAALAMAVGAAVWSVGRPFTGRAAQVPLDERTTEFFALHYSGVPVTDAQIVRLEVSKAALASFGLEDSRMNGAPTVLADVIVGSDGLARAIRFVDVGVGTP